MSQQLGIYISTSLRQGGMFLDNFHFVNHLEHGVLLTHAPDMHQRSNHEVNYVTVASRFENLWAIRI